VIDKNFHYIVRGVIRDGDYFLLCKQRNGDYTFLLGGHIDPGEGAKAALVREIKEEIGANVTVGSFRGAIENAWDKHSEISLVFDIKHSLTREVTPMPASPEEEHLAFLWAHRNELKAYNLLPKPLINWFQESEAKGWASTIE